MGKHDKKEAQATRFSWQPMPDEWYKARIQTLEQENHKLAKDLESANKFIEYLKMKIDATESNAITEMVSLEKMLLNAAKQVWGEE